MKTELELRQMFKNLSDCYADTWHSERGFMEEGDVVQAMTEDRFIEALKQVNFISSNPVLADSICLHEWDEGSRNVHKCKKCGKYNC